MTDARRFPWHSPDGSLSGADLVRECGSRLTDPTLWSEFQERFHKPILTIAMRILWVRHRRGNLNEACDAVQDAYVRLLANNGRLLRSFKGETDFSVKAFLARVIVNVLSDHHRAQQREKRRATEVVSLEEVRAKQQDPPNKAAELDLSAILSWIDVERLMESEPDKRNAARNILIFKLYYIDGFTAAEIAKFPGFGIKESSVHLVLENMRTSLKRRAEK